MGLLVFLVILIGYVASGCSLSCKDRSNKSVDWFIVYKLPMLENHSNPLIRGGNAFYYLDARNPEWQFSDVAVTEQQHAVAFTFNDVQRNANSSEILHFSYNDEETSSESRAHAKGLLGFDSAQGFWIIHSVPKWPGAMSTAYTYPSNGLRYGQTFICVTFSSKYIDVIARQLSFMFSFMYDVNVPEAFQQKYPLMTSVALHSYHVRSAPFNGTAQLFSVGSQPFLHFAKGSKWGRDLYSGWISDYINDDLYVESWRDGPGDMPSVCNSSLEVENCRRLEWPQKVSGEAVVVCSTRDHSKWAIAPGKARIMCIGDINRQISQEHRGGGTLCFSNPQAWSAFYSLVTWLYYCDPQPKPAPTDCP